MIQTQKSLAYFIGQSLLPWTVNEQHTWLLRNTQQLPSGSQLGNNAL